MAQDHSEEQTAYGLAALSICESLLTSLRDLRIIGELEVVGILKDASAAHHDATTGDGAANIHGSAAAIIETSVSTSTGITEV